MAPEAFRGWARLYVQAVLREMGWAPGDPAMQPGADVLAAGEVGRMLGTSAKQVRRLPLPKVRLGHRTVRYLREDVLKYLRARAQ